MTPTLKSIMAELKSKGREQMRKTYVRHGMPGDRMFGVSIADLKPIAKRIKGEQQLACDLFATGNLDAMYLAGLVADGALLSKKELRAWTKGAREFVMVAESTVPSVAVESPLARELALEWMASEEDQIAATGWTTYIGILATTPDEQLDLKEVARLLERVEKEIHRASNRVRYAMNGFVIAVGSYVKPLNAAAKAIGRKIGPVSVDMGDTACQVPLATAYIEKVEAAGKLGKKRKTMKC